MQLVCCTSSQDLSSEERFHVELHFSPGVKGVEEEENAPTGFGFRPASAEVARQVESQCSGWAVCFLLRRAAPVFLSPHVLAQNGQKQTDPGSLEDLSRDETDRAVPLSEPISIQRKSPLIRNHKTGSMEVTPSTFTILERPAATSVPGFPSYDLVSSWSSELLSVQRD